MGFLRLVFKACCLETSASCIPHNDAEIRKLLIVYPINWDDFHAPQPISILNVPSAAS